MALRPLWMHESVDLEHWKQWRLESLQQGQVHGAFHYQSPRQTDLWLNVFRTHSPAVTQPAVASIYERAAGEMAGAYRGKSVHVISLGCGDGRKDVMLLRALISEGAKVHWSPQDVSPWLVNLAAGQTAGLGLKSVHSVVADLESVEDLGALFDSFDSDLPRLFTFYGLVPNFEPGFLTACWSRLLRATDRILISANLAPVHDESRAEYLRGVELIQSQYDNPETQSWLTAVLEDWGLAEHLENYRVRLESRQELLRVVAVMDWKNDREFAWEGTTIRVFRGDNLRLFFSYRYTPSRLMALAAQSGLVSNGVWLGAEEGVWVLGKGPIPNISPQQ